jgi:hypothetical protein
MASIIRNVFLIFYKPDVFKNHQFSKEKELLSQELTELEQEFYIIFILPPTPRMPPKRGVFV